ncbi:MAG: hypothetical protein OEV88_10410 [Gammaproteobacteria bacterium]|nr:hypothetical protein [Gammaproteobacteria bacterium]
MVKRNGTFLKSWHLLLLVITGVLTALAWSGRFDTLSANYIDQALVNAGVIYATARGINALVSMLQGTELDVVMLTFSIGELLDPVNDLIERFSGIMLIALGSLAMQKILLGMVSHRIFNMLLTMLALGTGAALLARQQRPYQVLLRAFVVIAFVRFSLGLVVLANNWVDVYFLSVDDTRRHVAMEHFEGELRQLSAMSGVSGPSDELVRATTAQVASLEKTRIAEQETLQQRKIEWEQAGKRLDDLEAASAWWQRWNPLVEKPPALLDAGEELDRLESEMDSLEMTLSSIDAALAKEKENLACMQKRTAGETCSFLENVTSSLSPAEIGFRINALQGRVSDFAENAIALLMSALLKSVVIPLLFLCILIKLAGMSWSRIR